MSVKITLPVEDKQKRKIANCYIATKVLGKSTSFPKLRHLWEEKLEKLKGMLHELDKTMMLLLIESAKDHDGDIFDIR
uniref:hypothetical protein n=1 Tax=Alistipes sp. TaxID=1872444 RepID=UPI004057096A